MPLSYKIVLGSVALLCLVVIGFKAFSGDSPDAVGTPQPIAASSPNTNSNQPLAPTGGNDQVNTPIDSATAVDGSNNNNSASETAGEVTAVADANLADVTRQLADTTTQAAPDTSIATTSDASTGPDMASDASNDAPGDEEDKGLDDLLARIRQYESEVLGEEKNPKTQLASNDTTKATAEVASLNDTGAANKVENESATEDLADAITTEVATNTDDDTIAAKGDEDNTVTVPAEPPVVTIGLKAPMPGISEAKADGNVDSDAKSANTSGSTNQADASAESNSDPITSVASNDQATDEDTTIDAASLSTTADVNSNVVVDATIPPVVKPVNVDTTTPVNKVSSTDNNSDSSAANGKPVAGKTYTIKPGDTFSSIAITVYGAERHWSAIADANPRIDSRRMRVGQVIQLPDLNARTTLPAESVTARAVVQPTDKNTHTVRSGETLWGIAKKHYGKGELWRHLYNANRDVIGNKPGNVREGMKLRIAALPGR